MFVIGNAQCVDVCDDVMDKLGRPRGLIRYVVERPGGKEAAYSASEAIFVCRPGRRDGASFRFRLGGADRF